MTKKITCIFNTLREHIVSICENPAVRAGYILCDDERQKKGLFSRNRVWTFLRTVQAIMCCFKKTLNEEIALFLDNLKLQQTTAVAFIKRRGFISWELFRDINIWFVRKAMQSGLLDTWRCGMYLCGIDGSRLSLPYTVDLYRKYRQRDDKGHNLARAVFITDLTNRLIVAAGLLPNKTEERKAALQLMQNTEFPYDLLLSIFVMDRGYPSLQLMNWFHKNTGGFIIRARRDTNPQIAEFMDSDDLSKKVVLSLSDNRRDIDYERPQPIEVRLIKRPAAKGDGQPTVLITDLDEASFPDNVILEAYGSRWNTETEIGTEKNELQIEIFSGIRDICILQDFFAAILMYNMESIIRIPCNRQLQKHKGAYRLQVDMNCTWQVMTVFVYALFKPPRMMSKELTFIVNFFLRMRSVVRPGRHEPRKRRRIKISGKYITFTNYKRGL